MTVGHFEKQMKQVIIDFYVGLFVIELLYLQNDSILCERNLHLFPDFKLSLKFKPNLEMERALIPLKRVSISSCMILRALLSIL
jgi:hypothetical protein